MALSSVTTFWRDHFFGIFLSTVTVGSVMVLCLLASRIFFFDKLYYQKSPVLGYVSDGQNPRAHRNLPAIEYRIRDLRMVYPSTGKVLGSQDDRRKKVVVIGDSYVYGSGVEQQERFTSVLEKELNTSVPTVVYSLAQPGDSIIDNYSKYLQVKETLHPDIVIFGMVENDLYLGAPNKYPGEQEIYDRLRKVCPLPEYVNKPEDIHPGDSYDRMVDLMFAPTFQSDIANYCYLNEIAQRLRVDPTILFYSFTPLNQRSTKVEKVLLRYAKVIQDHGIKIFSPANLPGFHFESVSALESHPNAKTHQQYAESIAKEILPLLQ